MRLAFVHPFLNRYARGIERFTINLANALTRSEVEVHILTWQSQQPIQVDVLDSRVRVHTLPTSRYYAAQTIVPFYVWHFFRHTFDFAWIFFAGYGEAEALTIARQQQFGIVFHYPYAQVPHRYREFRRFGLAQRADRIVSVSRYVADGVRESLGRESVVIHHGVDTQRFAPNSEIRIKILETLAIPNQASLLITAAALEERKGVQWVLQALPLVLNQFPETQYLVLGDGIYRPELERQARTLGIDDHVRFLGAQTDVAPFYQAADVSLILSRGEASSLSALESLACGTPVIAAQRPPFDELIEPEYGVMVKEEDKDAVARAINDLLSRPAKGRAMGEAGRAHILDNFTWERVGDQYMQLLDHLFAKP